MERPGGEIKAQLQSKAGWKPKGLCPSAQEPGGILQSPLSGESRRPRCRKRSFSSLCTCSSGASLK